MTIRKRGASWQLDVTVEGHRHRETHETKIAAKKRELEIITNHPQKPQTRKRSESVSAALQNYKTRQVTGGTADKSPLKLSSASVAGSRRK